MKRIAATALLAMGLLHGATAAAQSSPARPDEQTDSSAAAHAAAERARAEAAHQLQASATEFTVVTVEPTQWRDSSLGCGKPGSLRAEVMSSGYVVVLERNGERHQVNVAGSRAILCEPNSRLSGNVRQPMSAGGLDRVTNLARQDLANRLRLDVQQIRVASVEPRRWTDDDMNCASGGGTAAAGSASATGYRLTLSASGRTYFYHTDLRAVRACPPN